MSYVDSLPDVVVRKAANADIPAVVGLHFRVLSSSLNSSFGMKHLSYIYSALLADSESAVMIAKVNDQCVGVASATMCPGDVRRLLVRRLSMKAWTILVVRVLSRPRLLYQWLRDRVTVALVMYKGMAIDACLTTLAVEESVRNRGIGSELLESIETFFREKGSYAYRVDTVESNEQARLFYRWKGFVEIEHRGQHVMLVKLL